MKNPFTEHPQSTDNPQGYWAHGFFSFTNSVALLWFCLLGIVHSVFPFIFKFNTSSAIIRSFKKIVKSNRHSPELVKYGVPDIRWNTVASGIYEQEITMIKNKQQQYVCEKTGRIVGFEHTTFGSEFVVDPEFLDKCECPIHSCKLYEEI